MSNRGVHEARVFAPAEIGQQKARRLGTRINFNTPCAVLAIINSAVLLPTAVVTKYLYIEVLLHQNQPLWPYLLPAPLMAFNLYLFMKQMGLYEPEALVRPEVGYGKLLGALAMSFLVLLGTLYIFKSAEFYSRVWFVSWFAVSAVALIAVRVIAMRRARELTKTGALCQRVALFGPFDFITELKTLIEKTSPISLVESLYVSHEAKQHNASVQGGLSELKAAMACNRFDTVIIGAPVAETGLIQTAVRCLSSYSTELLLCTELEPFPVSVQGNRNFGRLRTDVVDLLPLSERSRLVKLALDYTLSLAGILLFAPLFALVAIAIKLDSAGPVFFLQRRYGQNNRVFRILKFRTMVVAEDGALVNQAERNDPRVTRVGRILRRTSIDELPQLFNVLLGHMSIVGPRPHALAHDQFFEQQLDHFSRRRRVRPGLTGWAQVHGFRGETRTAEVIRARTEHDLYYIDNWSIWLDIEILTRTLFVISRGAY